MSITLWHELISKYFEFYLEEKLDLLGASIVALNATATASSCSEEGEGSGGTPAFQLEGPLRQLPIEFIDRSHEFVEKLYFGLPDGYESTCLDGENDKKKEGNRTTEHAAAAARHVCESYFIPKGKRSDGAVEVGCDDNHNPFLYGEVTSKGLRQVLTKMGVPIAVEAERGSSDTDWLFVDLGSGTGKMVVEASHILLSSGGCGPRAANSHHVSIGVELDPKRAAVAELALNKIKKEAMDALIDGSCGCEEDDVNAADVRMRMVDGKSIRFVCGDFLAWLTSEDGLSRTVSDSDGCTKRKRRVALFCCGVGFGEAFVHEICNAIDTFRKRNEDGGAPLATAVLLFRNHPVDHPLYHSAREGSAGELGVKQTLISTSWMDEAPAMVLRW